MQSERMIQKKKSFVCCNRLISSFSRFVWFKLCIQIKKTQYQKQKKGRPKKNQTKDDSGSFAPPAICDELK